MHDEMTFQSSAAPKDGCDPERSVGPVPGRIFQSSAAPKDGCDRAGARERARGQGFQSSAAPKDGCDGAAGDDESLRRDGLSILSRPEGRLRWERYQYVEKPRRLSILSRPEGRLRLSLVNNERRPDHLSILSRPEGRLRSATTDAATISSRAFQSSAAPKDGCDLRRLRWWPPRRRPFNPQPPRRTAAIGWYRCALRHEGFQSSAAPKDGCDRPR